MNMLLIVNSLLVVMLASLGESLMSKLKLLNDPSASVCLYVGQLNESIEEVERSIYSWQQTQGKQYSEDKSISLESKTQTKEYLNSDDVKKNDHSQSYGPTSFEKFKEIAEDKIYESISKKRQQNWSGQSQIAITLSLTHKYNNLTYTGGMARIAPTPGLHLLSFEHSIVNNSHTLLIYHNGKELKLNQNRKLNNRTHYYKFNGVQLNSEGPVMIINNTYCQDFGHAALSAVYENTHRIIQQRTQRTLIVAIVCGTVLAILLIISGMVAIFLQHHKTRKQIIMRKRLRELEMDE